MAKVRRLTLLVMRSWWRRIAPGDDSDRAQFSTVLVWLLCAGGVLGVAALAAAWERDWIGARGFLIGLLVLPVALYGTARIVWASIGASSRGLAQVLMAGGNLEPDPTFSAEEALVVRGRIDEARAMLEARLAAEPASLPIRFRLAALLRDDVEDHAAAERLYLEARTVPGAAAREDAIANLLIDLYQRTGNRGRLMAELARFAARHTGRPEGAAARRRLRELKDADPLTP